MQNNPTNKDPKLPMLTPKQDVLDKERAEDEGFNIPAQEESLEEARARLEKEKSKRENKL